MRRPAVTSAQMATRRPCCGRDEHRCERRPIIGTTVESRLLHPLSDGIRAVHDRFVSGVLVTGQNDLAPVDRDIATGVERGDRMQSYASVRVTRVTNRSTVPQCRNDLFGELETHVVLRMNSDYRHS